MSAIDDRHGVIACLRCKTRKIKCDREMPKCTNCEKSGKPCLTIDPATGRQVPRSYLNHLETRVKQLEYELETARQVTATSIPAYAWLPESEMPYHGEASGYSMANRLAHEMNDRHLHGIKFDNFTSLASTGEPFTLLAKDPWCLPVNLPPKREAEKHMQWYFEQINSTMPVFHREQFVRQYFEPVYGPINPELHICSQYTKLNLARSSTEPGTGTFYRRWVDCGNSIAAAPEPRIQCCLYFLYIIFALATVSDNRVASQHPERGPRFLSAAMNYYSVAGSGRSRDDQIRCLQAILLLSIYGAMMPMSSSAWFTTGNAMRMCVHMGLHNEADVGDLDDFTIDMQRRLFWTTYYIDRMTSLNMDRPYSIDDLYCTCPLPSMADDSWIQPTGVPKTDSPSFEPPDRPSYKWVFKNMLDLRKLQQRAKLLLYDEPCHKRADGKATEEDLREIRRKRDVIAQEVEDWYANLPRSPLVFNFPWNSQMFDVNYNHTKIILYRNSPGIAEPTTEEYRTVVDAGMRMLNVYVGFLQDLYFVYTWAATHNILQACTSIFYTLFRTDCFDYTFDLDSFEQLMNNVSVVMTQLKRACNAVESACDNLERIEEHSFKFFRQQARGGDSPKRRKTEDPTRPESLVQPVSPEQAVSQPQVVSPANSMSSVQSASSAPSVSPIHSVSPAPPVQPMHFPVKASIPNSLSPSSAEKKSISNDN